MPQIIMGAYYEGQATTVLALGAHAEGQRTRAPGLAAHAEGINSQAAGASSHAEGNGTYISPNGDSAHVEGINTAASAPYGHAEGNTTTASGQSGHAEGYLSEANGVYSHAGGLQSYANKIGQWARSSLQPATINAQRAQCSIYTMGMQTTATSTVFLTLDGTTALNLTGPTTNQLVIPLYSTYQFSLTLVTRRVGVATASQGWVYNGMIARDSGNARIVGTVTQTATWSDAALATVAITANTSSQYLQVAVTPATSTLMSFNGVLTVNELTVAS